MIGKVIGGGNQKLERKLLWSITNGVQIDLSAIKSKSIDVSDYDYVQFVIRNLSSPDDAINTLYYVNLSNKYSTTMFPVVNDSECWAPFIERTDYTDGTGSAAFVVETGCITLMYHKFTISSTGALAYDSTYYATTTVELKKNTPVIWNMLYDSPQKYTTSNYSITMSIYGVKGKLHEVKED